jgi:hypothetical protein
MFQAWLATENGKAESESPLLAEVGLIGQFRYGTAARGGQSRGTGAHRFMRHHSVPTLTFAGLSRGRHQAGVVS